MASAIKSSQSAAPAQPIPIVFLIANWKPKRPCLAFVSAGASSRIAHRVAAAEEEGERRGETKMKSGEERVPESNNVAQSAPLRVPGSLEEAYELGWQWQRESFAGLREFGTTKEGVVRREGLALFVSDEAEDIVIPFVATYAFGEPRVPKYPYAGGSVCLIDDDEEHAATVERKASRSKKEADEEKLWTIRRLLRGRVIHTYTAPIPITEEDAQSDAFDSYCEVVQLDVSEVKPKTPYVRRRTKKAKTRS